MSRTVFIPGVFLMVIFCQSCSDTTCKDVHALNLGVDDDCKYSRATFYITNSAYIDRFLNISYVERVEVKNGGRSLGDISKVGRPNNCSTAGTIHYQFTQGNPVDWSSDVYLSNGNVVTFSGTAEPSPANPCVLIKVD